MKEQWNTIFSGEFEGRKVKLLRYESGELKVITTQKEAYMSEGYSEGSSHVMPFVISEGATIHVDAQNPDELERELQDNGFSSDIAKEISNLAI
jgi:hypothetical protein